MAEAPQTLDELEPLERLHEKERAFVLALFTHGNRLRAAREAEYAHPPGDAVRVYRRPRVLAALRWLRETYADDVADAREIVAHLAGIVRDPEAKNSDRTAAAAQLLKAQGLIGPEVDARTQVVNVSISKHADLNLLDALDLLQRIAESESSPFAAEAGEVIEKILTAEANRPKLPG